MLPAQPVDATPSRALIRQCLRGATICLAVLGQNPARASVPAGLTLAGDFSFCFQCQAGSNLVLRRPIDIAESIRTCLRAIVENEIDRGSATFPGDDKIGSRVGVTFAAT
jgi:hypothetical protein